MTVPSPVALAALEDTSATYTGQLVDQDGEGVPGASLSSLHLTLVDLASRRTINGWSAKSILNTNGVEVDADGNITWQMTPEDNPVLGGGPVERHGAIVVGRWGSGKGLRHMFYVDVERIKV